MLSVTKSFINEENVKSFGGLLRRCWIFITSDEHNSFQIEKSSRLMNKYDLRSYLQLQRCRRIIIGHSYEQFIRGISSLFILRPNWNGFMNKENYTPRWFRDIITSPRYNIASISIIVSEKHITSVYDTDILLLMSYPVSKISVGLWPIVICHRVTSFAQI